MTTAKVPHPLVDLGERLRVGDPAWSLRAALVRYAQPQPARSAAVADLLRGVEHGWHTVGLAKAQASDAMVDEALAAAAALGDTTTTDPATTDPAIAVAAAALALDGLADLLSAWAAGLHTADERPDPTPDVDRVLPTVEQRLADGAITGWRDGVPPRGARSRG